MEKKLIKHQLSNKEFYLTPNWKINHLFIGTFNPEGGENVNYFYGRSRNKTWELISEIFKTELNPTNLDFFDKIKDLGIACVDMIASIKKSDNSMFSTIEDADIFGKGYTDSILFKKKYSLEFNTEQINELISKNSNIKAYSTWGNGPSHKNWKTEISKIKFTNNLVSPSMAARVPKGEKKIDYMLNDWKSKISI